MTPDGQVSIEKDVLDVDVFILKVCARSRGRFALIGENEDDVAVLRLSFLEDWHFSTTRRTPASPQIDYNRLADKARQLH